MSEQIHLSDGRSFVLQTSDGTWHVTIDGKFYCAASLTELRQGLAQEFQVQPPSVLHRIKPHIEHYEEMLCNSGSSLREKQYARHHLMRLAREGNQRARDLVFRLADKPTPSLAARALTADLGKEDFADVTHEELVENVSNLVLRSQLILELARRLEI